MPKPIKRIQTYTGQNFDAVEKYCKDMNLRLRVASNNGVQAPRSADFRDDRINVELDNGIVVGAFVG